MYYITVVDVVDVVVSYTIVGIAVAVSGVVSGSVDCIDVGVVGVVVVCVLALSSMLILLLFI